MSQSDQGDRNEPQAYAIGEVVNGHVWTGAEWVPVQDASMPPAPGRRLRGRWFRPKVVIGSWVVLILIVLVLGFIPNSTVQMVVSIAWFFIVLIALPATLIALILWLAGVGARTQ